MRLLERSRERQSIEENGGSHHYNQSSNWVHEEQGNFIMKIS